MRHRRTVKKLGRKKSHKELMIRNLVAALLKNEAVRTTEAKAKEARRLAERLITWGKMGDLHSRRLAFARIRDAEVVKKVFDVLAPKFQKRNGGYTRIIKLERRRGDNAPMVLLELTEKTEQAAAEKESRKAKREGKKAKSAGGGGAEE